VQKDVLLCCLISIGQYVRRQSLGVEIGQPTEVPEICEETDFDVGRFGKTVKPDRSGAFVCGMFDKDDGSCCMRRMRNCAKMMLCDVVDDLENVGEQGPDLDFVARVFEIERIELGLEFAIKSTTEHESGVAECFDKPVDLPVGIALKWVVS
jgi:hypothetical protein